MEIAVQIYRCQADANLLNSMRDLVWLQIALPKSLFKLSNVQWRFVF
jgi:hypothetical protein